MAEENKPKPDDKQKDNLIEELRAEWQAEFAKLKGESETLIKAQQEEIAKLVKSNQELQSALVRSAVNPPEPKKEEKTPEELYREEVEALSKKALENIKARLTE